MKKTICLQILPYYYGMQHHESGFGSQWVDTTAMNKGQYVCMALSIIAQAADLAKCTMNT